MADPRQRRRGAIRSFIAAEPETQAKKFADHSLEKIAFRFVQY